MKQRCKFLNVKQDNYAHGTIYYSDYHSVSGVIIAVTIVNGCRLLSKTTHLFPKGALSKSCHSPVDGNEE